MNLFIMDGHYIRLFEHWQHVISPYASIDEATHKIIEKIASVQTFSTDFFIVHDYRDLSVRFISESVYDYSGFYPENFYAQGIELEMQCLRPKELSKVLTLQKMTHDLLKEVPMSCKKTALLTYCTPIRHRNREIEHLMLCKLKPLLMSEDGSLILDLVQWTDLSALQINKTFDWCFTYTDAKGKKIHVRDHTPIDHYLTLLSSAEERILRELKNGKDSKAIAKSLALSKHTVDTHRRNILKKTNCKSTLELIRKLSGSTND